jgi:ligand-binding sensor domain-containing protein
MTRAWRDKDGDLWVETDQGQVSCLDRQMLDRIRDRIGSGPLADVIEAGYGPLEELLTAAELQAGGVLTDRPDVLTALRGDGRVAWQACGAAERAYQDWRSEQDRRTVQEAEHEYVAPYGRRDDEEVI